MFRDGLPHPVQPRRWLAMLLWCMALPAQASPLPPACSDWPTWHAFKDAFIAPDGRVVDWDDPQHHTVSEGQGYALFFSLVANDRATFRRLLQWTQANLAQGNLAAHLPAWRWGRKEDGSWGVLDANSATDADLWLAYTLLEAGRLWQQPRYRALGRAMAAAIARAESANLPRLGPTLLPGAHGFELDPSSWRLNPSYLPLQALRRLAHVLPHSSWPALTASSVRVLMAASRTGWVPEWIVYHRERGFLPDPTTGGEGSYNAIRVYLWVGMLSPHDPVRRPLYRQLQRMADFVSRNGVPPERVDTVSGKTLSVGPAGFSAALVPYLSAWPQHAAQAQQLARARAGAGQRNYYGRSLQMFGLGWHEKRFRFSADGKLLLVGGQRCLTP